ncbi:winged helix-turn-helix domain-containing protein [Streptomyces carpinensis]|uniref:Winged helix-turn-helix domain-containing protein n=1 Tax=Streptomyces carpinensis TaxID=66369 RepID=A0ABV1VXZ1_9ACTN|nr:winged helix-turn-helix domain-containing protein [Streptomyces carpinensis]
MAALIGRIHVSDSISGATRLMRRLGFTPQVPARRAAERNEQAIASWREATWAQVKPNHEGGLPGMDLFRGRSRIHPQAADRTHLGATLHRPDRESVRPPFREGLRRRADPDAP